MALQEWQLGKDVRGPITHNQNRTAGAEGTIVFGRALMRGTESDQVKQWDGSAADLVFMGLAKYSNEAKYQVQNITPTQYEDGDVVYAATASPGFCVMYTGSTAIKRGDKIAISATGTIIAHIAAAGTSGTYGANIDAVAGSDAAPGEYLEINLKSTKAEVIQL